MQDRINDKSQMALTTHWGALWAFAGAEASTAASADRRSPSDSVAAVPPQMFINGAADADIAQLAAEIFDAAPELQGFQDDFRPNAEVVPEFVEPHSPLQRLIVQLLETDPNVCRLTSRKRDMWLSELAARIEISHNDDLVAGAAGIAMLFDRAARRGGEECSAFRQAQLIMQRTWPLLARHLLIDETVVYPLCGYIGQGYRGAAPTLEVLFSPLSREHAQIAAALEMMHNKLEQRPLGGQCPEALELLQAVEFFGYAWETHAVKVDKVLLPRLRHVLSSSHESVEDLYTRTTE